VTVRSANEHERTGASKDLGRNEQADAEIHVVVSRVRRQQIEKARAAGTLPKGVVVERR
jgi:hypothetical protein